MSIKMVVASGFQCNCITQEAESVFFSCRWDLADTYFNYKPVLLERLKDYTLDMTLLREYFGTVKILSIYEDEKARIIYLGRDPE